MSLSSSSSNSAAGAGLPDAASATPPLDDTSSRLVASTLQVQWSEFDSAAIQTSIAALSALLPRVEAQHDLEQAHADLQKAYRDEQARSADIQRRFDEAAASAAPFVQFCLGRYDRALRDLQETQVALADCKSALADRHDNSQKLRTLRTKLRTEKQAHEEAVAWLHSQNDELQSRLDSAAVREADLRVRLAAAPTAPPAAPAPPTSRTQALGRRVVALRAELAAAVSSLDQTQRGPQRSQSDVEAYASSQQALQNAISQLHSEKTELEAQAADLRSKLGNETRKAARQAALNDAERDRLRAHADDIDKQRVTASADLQRAIRERNRLRSELQTTQSQISTSRSAVARLERRLSDLQVDRQRIAMLEQENSALTTQLAVAQDVRAKVEDDRDRAVRERDTIRARVAGSVDLVQPASSAGAPITSDSAPSGRPARSNQPLSVQTSPGGSTSKRRRSESAAPASSSAPPRRRPRISSPLRTPQPRSDSSAAPSSGHSLGPSSPSRSTSSISRSTASVPGRRLRGGRRSRTTPNRARQPPVSPDSDDPLRAGLAQSRTATRRHRRSSVTTAGGSPTRPISLDSSSEGSNSHAGPSPNSRADRDDSSSEISTGVESVNDQSDIGQVATEAADSDGGQVDSAAGSGQDDGSAGSDDSIVSAPRSHRNTLLPAAGYAQLAPTVVPRDQWIPGYRDRGRYPAAAIAPWSPDRIRRISVLELDIELLFHHFSQPKGWLFPRRGRAPRPRQWCPELITEQEVKTVYATKPWTVFDRSVVPRSFRLDGWFAPHALRYQELVSEHQQALWESTHAFQISSFLRKQLPFLAKLWTGRKQRRSRLGARWKAFLKRVLASIIAGQYDLDILLDPHFLNYPRPGEMRSWYPGFGMSPRPTSLADALRAVDAAEPWRIRYRGQIENHPGSQIDRLTNKFVPPAAVNDA